MLFGVLVASNAMTSSLDRIVHQSTGEVDVAIGPAGSFDATLPPGTEEEVRALPDVVRTVGEVGLRTSLVTHERTLDELAASTGSLVDDSQFILLIGSDLAATDELIGLPLAEGRLPTPARARARDHRRRRRRVRRGRGGPRRGRHARRHRCRWTSSGCSRTVARA